ncbi:MAG TPA: hypothetical protein VG986_17320 [Pseudolabrys sp.]|nr:hypothetical protein [Pseudolabrys sp.]
MRRLVFAMAAALSLFAASSLVPNAAEAAPISAPAGMHAAVVDRNLAQEVAYVCRRVWRCGAYGCGWRRVCGWRPGYRAYGWYGRGYWYGGRYWRHRYWRRHGWHYY